MKTAVLFIIAFIKSGILLLVIYATKSVNVVIKSLTDLDPVLRTAFLGNGDLSTLGVEIYSFRKHLLSPRSVLVIIGQSMVNFNS
jgi:hypothetical protein